MLSRRKEPEPRRARAGQADAVLPRELGIDRPYDGETWTTMPPRRAVTAAGLRVLRAVKCAVGMFATLGRFTDDEIPVPDGSSATELRTFYSTWQSELSKV
jgi:hypothetical protein